MYWVPRSKCYNNTMHLKLHPRDNNDIHISPEPALEAPRLRLIGVFLRFWIFWVYSMNTEHFKIWFLCFKYHYQSYSLLTRLCWSLSWWIWLMSWGCVTLFLNVIYNFWCWYFVVVVIGICYWITVHHIESQSQVENFIPVIHKTQRTFLLHNISNLLCVNTPYHYYYFHPFKI